MLAYFFSLWEAASSAVAPPSRARVWLLLLLTWKPDGRGSQVPKFTLHSNAVTLLCDTACCGRRWWSFYAALYFYDWRCDVAGWRCVVGETSGTRERLTATPCLRRPPAVPCPAVTGPTCGTAVERTAQDETSSTADCKLRAVSIAHRLGASGITSDHRKWCCNAFNVHQTYPLIGWLA